MIKKIYDKIYHSRHLVVIYHNQFNPLQGFLSDMAGCEWYCGYMQVLPQDKEWKLVQEGHNGYWDLDDKAYPTAIGGITYTGTLGEPFDDGKKYVGFDTNHFGTSDAGLNDCIAALKGMTEYAENEKNKEN